MEFIKRKKIYIVNFKENGSFIYYGSLQAILLDPLVHGVSASSLYKHDFEKTIFENDFVYIHRNYMETTGTIREFLQKAKGTWISGGKKDKDSLGEDKL